MHVCHLGIGSLRVLVQPLVVLKELTPLGFLPCYLLWHQNRQHVSAIIACRGARCANLRQSIVLRVSHDLRSGVLSKQLGTRCV